MKTKKEIAALLKVTPRTVSNLEKRGLLPPAVKRGNHKQSRAFFPDDAIDYIAQQLALRDAEEEWQAEVARVRAEWESRDEAERVTRFPIAGTNGEVIAEWVVEWGPPVVPRPGENFARAIIREFKEDEFRKRRNGN